MKLRDVKSILEAEVLVGNDYLDKDIKYAFSSDLMSDVLAYVKKHTLLLTGLANAQVIRTAEMIDLTTIVFVRNKRPSAEIIDLAKENGMIIMSTKYTLYTASGKLYNSGLQGITICE